MDDAELITSKYSLTLDLPPSCIQFCPSFPDIFVVGTYNLEKEENDGDLDETASDSELRASQPQSRNGSLLVFRLLLEEPVLLQTVLQPSAVLDIRFHPTKKNIFAVASSTGTLSIHQLDPVCNPEAPLQELAVSQPLAAEDGTLFLQCQWHPAQERWIGVTASNGLAYLLVLGKVWQVSRMIELSLESPLEPWSIAFSPPKKLDDGSMGFVVYTGSDDSVLRFASYATNSQLADGMHDNYDAEVVVPVHEAIVTKKHTAGVTAILPLSITTPDGGRLVFTGSYDDHIRLFSMYDLDRTAGFPMVSLLLEENLGGGVWRLDPITIEENAGAARVLILVSCMHAGARLVEFSSADCAAWKCEVLARFEEHKSMNYGSDFVRGMVGDLVRCVSTSFYDRLLCVWEYKKSS